MEEAHTTVRNVKNSYHSIAIYFIDKEKFSNMNRKEDSYIAFIGRLSKEKGIENLAPTVIKMAEAEGLTAHANSIAVRFND